MATTTKLIISGALLALASCSCEKNEPVKGLVKKAVVRLSGILDLDADLDTMSTRWSS